ncbi:MAG: hypothetical protein RLZZ419_921, partial [Pseudomonadota bacterium]
MEQTLSQISLKLTLLNNNFLGVL